MPLPSDPLALSPHPLVSSKPPLPDLGPGHVLGEVTGDPDGPVVLALAGMHGNEPAGVRALLRVLARLQAGGPQLRGRFVALVGNLGALRQGRRYLERDLNRQWDAAALARLEAGCAGSAEDLEQIELLHAFRHQLARARGPVTLLDLHSMSAHGVPFTVLGEHPRSQQLGRQLVLPGIAGLEQALPGTTLDFFLAQGHAAVAVEGGQHDAPRTLAVLEAVTWRLLVAAGLLHDRDLPELDVHRQRLVMLTDGMPQAVHVIYRHGVEPTDRFRMRPGFHNLQPVRAGQVLAEDARGEVCAPQSGWILLPLYQPVGSDGFFIGTAF